MTSSDRLAANVGPNQGQAMKAAVRAATTANITLSGEQTLDGVACVAADRVLVKDQTTGADNGIYAVSSGTWTRPTDCDGNSDFVTGTIVYISGGTTYAGHFYALTTSGTITIGTTSQTWASVFNVTAGAASTIAPGIVELATSDETITGTDAVRAVTPAGLTAYGLGFPAGTRVLFNQTLAPTGWTKITTYNDVGLRVTSGDVADYTAGSAFSTVFAQTATGSTTITESTGGVHIHSLGAAHTPACTTGSAKAITKDATHLIQDAAVDGTTYLSPTAGGAGHTHTVALHLNYADVIIARKN